MLHFEYYHYRTQIFQPILFTYHFQLSSEQVLKQEFMPKNALISWKIVKIAQRWGPRLCPQTFYASCSWRLRLHPPK